MKKCLLSLFLASLTTIALSQTTVKPIVRDQNTDAEILGVLATDDVTIVVISFYSIFAQGWDWVSLSKTTELQYTDPKTGKTISLPAILLKRGKDYLASSFGKKYRITDFGPLPAEPTFSVCFDPLPEGVYKITVTENVKKHGFYWGDIFITPRQIFSCPSIGVNTTDERIDKLISETDNPYRGYYESIDEEINYRLALLKHENGSLYLVYVNGAETIGTWAIGDVKAMLRQSASSSIYKADWYMSNKEKNTNCFITFEGGVMNVMIDGETHVFIQMAGQNDSNPNIAEVGSNSWSGTCFALNDGYVVTNFHVVDNAKRIDIYGVNGNINIPYKASVVGVDRSNDLALLKIEDTDFKGFGSVPYKVNTSISDVGEDVFVLGYPLTTTMGNEVKLTNGIISSRTGYEGDLSLYQISAPIQPGNSGGPVFNIKGELIGIVCAKHGGAENASYAIKASYLNNLIESMVNSSIIPNQNSVNSLSLTDQVKVIKPFVFLIKCMK